MLKGKQLAAKIASLSTLPFTGTVYRLIHVKYAETALSSIGSYRLGGRYNLANTFEALYLADSPITALQEVEMLFRQDEKLFPVKGAPRILLSVEVTLSAVLDLTDVKIQKALGTNPQELTGSWIAVNAAGHAAPTQMLGQACFRHEAIEGLKVPSARDHKAFNLAVFPENLKVASDLRVFDHEGLGVARLPGRA
ncbi:MAG: RES family NAD+ phosphorylase [Gammaproteobacteria bacterium]